MAHQFPGGGLTLKQAGFMLIMSGIVVGGFRFAMSGLGNWGIYLALSFVVSGLLLTILGLRKKILT